jgi:hypothetical protein
MFAEEGVRRHNRNSEGKWLNSPVRLYEGSPQDVRTVLPDFERRNFAVNHPDKLFPGINPRLDLIVRKPMENQNGRLRVSDIHKDDYIPIGTVSKEYRLVPHKQVFDTALVALAENDIDPSHTRAELLLTEYGERMHLSIYLPHLYDFDPGDGHPIAMRLECFNSVEGSTRFKAFVGWLRFVCMNGFIIGVTTARFQHRHDSTLDIIDIGSVLKNGIAEGTKERENFRKWRKTTVEKGSLPPWINETVYKAWGFKAATRAYHIAHTGCDAEIVGTYKDMRPTTIAVKKTKKIPGTPEQAQNAYDISQILAWLAKERNDVEERLTWRQQIPELMKVLLN